MYEIYSQIVDYLKATWRRRWYAIAAAWLIAGAGWIYVANLPDRYHASARVYIDMDSMLRPLMRGLAVEMNLFQQIDIMQRTLLSRPNLEKVILMTDLDLTVQTEQEKEALIEKLRRKIRLARQGRNLFVVGYSDTDPNLTKRVVQAVLQIFVEGNLGASRKDMDATRRFLEDQIHDVERQLEAQEDQMARFKRENMGLLGGANGYYAKMQEMRSEVAKTSQQITEQKSVRDELKVQLEKIPQYLEVAGADTAGGGLPPSNTQVQIFQLERSRDELLLRYTPQHPDVIAIEKRLEQLKEQMKAEQENMAAVTGDPSSNESAPSTNKNVVPNPLYKEVKLQLVQYEANIAALQRRLQKEKQNVTEWAKLAGQVPEVEAAYQRLNRDYSILKGRYDKLRSRQESANLARELETKAQKVQFRVVDPPRVPIQPSGPDRSIYFVGVLLAGLGAGVALAFLLGQLSTTFASPQKLRSAFALPVLGSVTAIVSARDRRRAIRELLGFGFVSASLFLAFGGLMAIEVFGRAEVIATVKGLGIV